MRSGRAARLIRWSGRALDRLVPPGCAACGTAVPPGPPLCKVCESLLPVVPRPHCRRCGAPRTSALDAGGTGVCAICDPWPENLRRAASAVLHAPPADALVAGLKYRGWSALAPRMADYLVEPARRAADAGDTGPASPVLIPVPLDRRRERRRGFNQAGLLANELAARTGWRSMSGLRRRAPVRRQAELGREERMTNVMTAFTWDPSLRPPREPVLLVDDVLTTGATAAACAAAVEAGGGHCLGIVTFARALPRPDEA